MAVTVRSVLTGESLFPEREWTLESAEEFLRTMPDGVRELYEISADDLKNRLLLEGLAIGDLEHILLPRVSVDEYMAKDGDNTVVAFFVKGEPDAIEPLRLFCDGAKGVVFADAGDSDTLENTSIIYVEFPEDPSTKDIDALIKAVARIGGISPEDMSTSFSHVKSRFPYSKPLIDAYFSEKK